MLYWERTSSFESTAALRKVGHDDVIARYLSKSYVLSVYGKCLGLGLDWRTSR